MIDNWFIDIYEELLSKKEKYDILLTSPLLPNKPISPQFYFFVQIKSPEIYSHSLPYLDFCPLSSDFELDTKIKPISFYTFHFSEDIPKVSISLPLEHFPSLSEFVDVCWEKLKEWLDLLPSFLSNVYHNKLIFPGDYIPEIKYSLFFSNSSPLSPTYRDCIFSYDLQGKGVLKMPLFPLDLYVVKCKEND